MKMIRSLIVILAFLSTVSFCFLIGCKKDTAHYTPYVFKYCDTAHCQGHSYCDSATRSCICLSSTGYEGADCHTLIRDKYMGNYTGNANCTPSGSTSYHLFINSGVDNNEVFISGFPHSNSNPVGGLVDSNSHLTIPRQDPVVNNFISGTGTISADRQTVTINYLYEDIGVGTYTCTAVFTRQ